jgi:thymidylate synthase (FAD)
MKDFIDREIKILDKGFVRVVDVMGEDSSIVQAARVSYASGTKTINEDRGLIRFLMRHKHTTPFEMCEIKLHIKCPIFVARQWLRHRTANVNEMSARYSTIEDDFFVPSEEDLSTQSAMNKQGRQGSCDISEIDCKSIVEKISSVSQNSFDEYNIMLNEYNLTRELARIVLPQNAYTQFYWKIDLHNLLHFLRLRAHKKAQKEIRDYAFAILEIVKQWVPLTYEAFDDYIANSVNFSKQEAGLITKIINQEELQKMIDSSQNDVLGKTEFIEFIEKLKKLKQ